MALLLKTNIVDITVVAARAPRKSLGASSSSAGSSSNAGASPSGIVLTVIDVAGFIYY